MNVLIRLGGLAAMVGGLGYAVLWSPLGGWLVGHVELGPLERPIRSGSIEAPVMNVLVVGAMASLVAIAVLHVVRRRSSSRSVALSSLAGFTGLAMGLAGYGIGYLRGDFFLAFADTTFLVGGGLVLATVGIVALGIVTIKARVSPWWCGAALIAGSPLFVIVWLQVPWVGLTLIGVPWVVVGYALFSGRFRGEGREPIDYGSGTDTFAASPTDELNGRETGRHP